LKTVFIFLRLGISNRNLLRTDFLRTLKDHSGTRVVLFSPVGGNLEFRRENESENVIVEEWCRTRLGFWEKQLKNIKHWIWLATQRDFGAQVKYRGLHGLFGYYWRSLLGRMLVMLGVNAQTVNHLELKIFRPHSVIRELYDRYRPSLVLFTRVFGTNQHVVKEAKRRAIPTVCLMESWDNLTLKGPLSVVPDRLVVWNEVNKNEALNLHQFREEDVLIAGIPQFDLYQDKSLFASKGNFLNGFTIGPEVKLITYAATSEWNAKDEIETIEYLYNAILNGSIKYPCHLIVRMYPTVSPDLSRRYYSHFEQRPKLTLQSPGRPSKLHDGWDPDWFDMVLFARTLYHSDVVVNAGTTVTLDAAYLDTPIVCVAFDGHGKNRDYMQSCRRLYDYPHFRSVVHSGGVRMAYTPQEMIQWVNAYLGNPALDSEGRMRLKKEQAHFVDGKSAKRMAKIVIRELGMSGQDTR